MKSSLVASLFISVHGIPTQQQTEQQAIPTEVKCRDQISNQDYSPNEQWTQNRVFQEGATKGMEGQFRCTCQENGGITCRSLSLPCIFQDKGYEIGEKFKIEDYGASHIDYQCACLGQPNGQIQCSEINAGCWDVHTQKKYALDASFEQTRADDDLIRDCQCTGDEKTRLIKCALTRYCKLNGNYLKIGEEEVIETDTQKQTCTCVEAGRTSCIIEAKPIQPEAVIADQIPEAKVDVSNYD